MKTTNASPKPLEICATYTHTKPVLTRSALSHTHTRGVLAVGWLRLLLHGFNGSDRIATPWLTVLVSANDYCAHLHIKLDGFFWPGHNYLDDLTQENCHFLCVRTRIGQRRKANTLRSGTHPNVGHVKMTSSKSNLRGAIRSADKCFYLTHIPH